MGSLAKRLVAASLLTFTACGPTVESLPDDTSGAGKGGSGSGSGGSGSAGSLGYAGSGGTGPGWPSSPDGFAGNPPTSDHLVCPGTEPLESQTFASVAEKQQALIGTWMQCSQQGIGPEDAAGLEIGADGRYTVLVRDDKGQLVRGVGVLHEGHIELDGNVVYFTNPGVSEQTMLHFSSEGVYRMYTFNTDFIGYDYVR
jgi:hypothetical protein